MAATWPGQLDLTNISNNHLTLLTTLPPTPLTAILNLIFIVVFINMSFTHANAPPLTTCTHKQHKWLCVIIELPRTAEATTCTQH